MSDEHGPLFNPLREWDYDDQYNGGYYNQLSIERTDRLHACWRERKEVYKYPPVGMEGPFVSKFTQV